MFDSLSKVLWGTPLENKNRKTITNECSNILSSSKRKPIKIDFDRGTKLHIFVFQNILKVKNLHHYSRYTVEGPCRSQRLIKTIRNLLKKPVFEKRNANWLCELPSAIEKYYNTIPMGIN